MRSRIAVFGLLSMAVLSGPVDAKDLRTVGVTVGSLGNPFFVTLGKGAEAAARKINPDARVTVVASDYDLNKQASQMDNFVAAGADLILLDAVDPNAVTPAVKRAQAAGVVVVGVDEVAKGEDATVVTDNVRAGEMSCQVIVDRLHGRGDVVIVNGPQVSSVVARIKGCGQAFAKAPGIHVLSSEQDAKGSRDGGLSVMQGLLTRFPHLDAAFAINDPSAIGASLAMRQLRRTDMFITSVDGSPDIEGALKDPSTKILASASQDPYAMAVRGVELGNDILHGNRPADPIELMPPQLITPENVARYTGWSAPR
jgi:ribose transport system substrate-binding protein